MTIQWPRDPGFDSCFHQILFRDKLLFYFNVDKEHKCAINSCIFRSTHVTNTVQDQKIFKYAGCLGAIIRMSLCKSFVHHRCLSINTTTREFVQLLRVVTYNSCFVTMCASRSQVGLFLLVLMGYWPWRQHLRTKWQSSVSSKTCPEGLFLQFGCSYVLAQTQITSASTNKQGNFGQDRAPLTGDGITRCSTEQAYCESYRTYL